MQDGTPSCVCVGEDAEWHEQVLQLQKELFWFLLPDLLRGRCQRLVQGELLGGVVGGGGCAD